MRAAGGGVRGCNPLLARLLALNEADERVEQKVGGGSITDTDTAFLHVHTHTHTFYFPLFSPLFPVT